MKITCINLLIILYVFTANAQNISFERVMPSYQRIADFKGVHHGAVAFADVNGDNNIDVLITGERTGWTDIAELYTSDGNGNFHLQERTPFIGVKYSAVAFADVDGDNDQDVLLAGYTDDDKYVTRLYINDGDGNFYWVYRTPFVGVAGGSFSFADIDGDNDLDVVISGRAAGGVNVTRLYKNNGLGTFSVVYSASFSNVSYGCNIFADVDGDDDLDLFISGSTNDGVLSELYKNDGNGIFILETNTPFTDVSLGSNSFADVDGDNDLDLLITGDTGNGVISKLYLNSGNGKFSLVKNTPFQGVRYGSIAFSDIDGDNDSDLLITGENSSKKHTSEFYINDGSGVFSVKIDSLVKGISESSIAFADVDGDNDDDLVITGNIKTSSPNDVKISEFYMNDGTGNFILASGSVFEGLSSAAIDFSDIDGDGDQDVIITGYNDVESKSNLYTNDGAGIFSLVAETPFTHVRIGAVNFVDVDADGDDDLLISGHTGSEEISELYSNDGAGNFTLVTGTPFKGVRWGSTAVFDVDGDGDQDVLINGYDNDDSSITELYTNDGSGHFTLVNTSLSGVHFSAVAVADIDGDNDLDVLLSGKSYTGWPMCELYTNDGNGIFTLVANTPFTPVEQGSAAFGDLDGDGDQDLVVTGHNSVRGRISDLFINDGAGNFTVIPDTPFLGLYQGDVSFEDVDGDSDLDLMMMGHTKSSKTTALYVNDGSGNFAVVDSMPFKVVSYGDAKFADIDGDNDKDLIIAGLDLYGKYFTELWRNTTVPLIITGSTTDEQLPQDQIVIYPNPSNGLFNVAFEMILNEVTVNIFNIQGKKITSSTYNNVQEINIDINQSSGVYYAEFLTSNGQQTVRLIKK